jgi:hypothetical protein
VGQGRVLDHGPHAIAGLEMKKDGDVIEDGIISTTKDM